MNAARTLIPALAIGLMSGTALAQSVGIGTGPAAERQSHLPPRPIWAAVRK